MKRPNIHGINIDTRCGCLLGAKWCSRETFVVQEDAMKHLLVGNEWFFECSKLLQESLLVTWLGISPQEVSSKLMVPGGKHLTRVPSPEIPQSFNLQRLAFMVTDMLAAQLERCVPSSTLTCADVALAALCAWSLVADVSFAREQRHARANSEEPCLHSSA
jgi:hypothetical protein